MTNTDKNFQDIHHVFTDILVIGTGVAGLRAALAVDDHLRVLLVTKDKASHSNTQNAQGGVAISFEGEGSVESHIRDTLRVGCGLCDPHVVKEVCSGGESEFHQLLKWGARFDTQDGQIALGLEGGHSRHRIIHAEGARTGREIVRVLLSEVSKRANLKILENNFLVNFLLDEGRIAGVLVRDSHRFMVIHASQVLVATGGLGQVYRETSNPSIATGDGLAAAIRIGTGLKDMEFIQFHPTTLYIAGAARVLISEAVRGAGGRLIDSQGVPFMEDIHPQGDLAPRDIVSRAILDRIQITRDTKVYLDVRHLRKFKSDFPFLNQMCLDFGVDPAQELIPVHPSAHYHIGGIEVDLDGRTSVEGLYAAGEVARNGLHGANRLASNSLLEGLVLGRRTGEVMSACFQDLSKATLQSPRMGEKSIALDTEDMRRSLRHLMWRQAGIVRNETGLLQAQQQLQVWHEVLVDWKPETPGDWELVNMVLVAREIVRSALERRESRGVHFRSDYPKKIETSNF